MSTRGFAVVAVALVLALASEARAGDPVPGFAETVFRGGFSQPTAIAFLPDGRMLVTEKSGHLYLTDGSTTSPITTIPVCSGSEMGLLGVAVDPAYNTNGGWPSGGTASWNNMAYIQYIKTDDGTEGFNVVQDPTAWALSGVSLTPNYVTTYADYSFRVPAVDNYTVYVNLLGRLNAMDAITQRVIWTWGQFNFGASPAVSNGIVYFYSSYLGQMTALNAAQAAGSIVRGLSQSVANELDEFISSSVRNTLVGLPLDLAAVNIARGRSEGIPGLNVARQQFFDATRDAAVLPYANWFEFGLGLKHPESLINFVAAYGTDPSIVNAAAVPAGCALMLVYELLRIRDYVRALARLPHGGPER
jgi:hypothetical protein